jgi:hypothetical protein
MGTERRRPCRGLYLAVGALILTTAVACVSPPATTHPPTSTTTLPHGPCAAGSYSTTANEPCFPAPPGFYVGAAGSRAATPCAAGSYQPSIGQTACLPAPIGFYVDTVAQSVPAPCPAGTTTTTEGASSASDCVQVRMFTFSRTVGINTTSTTSLPFSSPEITEVTASVTIHCSTTGQISEPWGGGVLAHVSGRTRSILLRCRRHPQRVHRPDSPAGDLPHFHGPR